MVISSIGAGGLAALAPLIEYFRPAKSPYLLAVVFGVASLVTLNVLFNKDLIPDKFFYWLFLSLPVALVLGLLTFFFFSTQSR